MTARPATETVTYLPGSPYPSPLDSAGSTTLYIDPAAIARRAAKPPIEKQVFPELRLVRDPPELVEAAALAAKRLIESIASHCSADRLSRAVDAVYDALDDRLLSNSFVEAEILITALTQNEVPLAVRLSALAISTPWRKRFEPTHEELKDRIRKQALQEGGEEKVAAVFRGIR